MTVDQMSQRGVGEVMDEYLEGGTRGFSVLKFNAEINRLTQVSKRFDNLHFEFSSISYFLRESRVPRGGGLSSTPPPSLLKNTERN